MIKCRAAATLSKDNIVSHHNMVSGICKLNTKILLGTISIDSIAADVIPTYSSIKVNSNIAAAASSRSINLIIVNEGIISRSL